MVNPVLVLTVWRGREKNKCFTFTFLASPPLTQTLFIFSFIFFCFFLSLQPGCSYFLRPIRKQYKLKLKKKQTFLFIFNSCCCKNSPNIIQENKSKLPKNSKNKSVWRGKLEPLFVKQRNKQISDSDNASSKKFEQLYQISTSNSSFWTRIL